MHSCSLFLVLITLNYDFSSDEMVKLSLNDIDKQIAALSKGAVSESSDSESDSETSQSVSDVSESASSFSGYSCDSSSSEESDESEEESDSDISKVGDGDKPKVNFDKKANDMVRKKARLGMSSICFAYLLGKCAVPECIYHHISLTDLDEEKKGELTRELHKRPFDKDLGSLVKTLNIPVCKTYTKTGECKFMTKCKFWHIDSENTAKWAGSEFWCSCCRKAFTSDTQFREHCNGKFHKQNAAHSA